MSVSATSRSSLRAQGEARALGAVGRRVPIAISRTGQGSNSATSRSLDRLITRANGSQRVGKDGVPNPFGDDAGSNKQQEATGISQSAFDIVFGKPAAPKELYETIANDARKLQGRCTGQGGTGRRKTELILDRNGAESLAP